MSHTILAGVDTREAADDRRAALSFVTEAFAEAILAGVDSEHFAHAALFAAMQELVATYGETAVERYCEKLPERIRNGEFTVAGRH